MVVSNPPYVPLGDRAGLQREVARLRARCRSLRGPTGFEIYEKLVADTARVLRPGGWLVLELGYTSKGPRDLFDARRVLVRRTSDARSGGHSARLGSAGGAMKTIFPRRYGRLLRLGRGAVRSSLKAKAVVVGGRPNERGVVSAASYESAQIRRPLAMPLRTAYKNVPARHLCGRPSDRYRDCSEKVFEVLNHFSPQVEMASIDEAYLDMTGTERLHGPPLRAAHSLHEAMREATRLNCSIGVATSRLVAKFRPIRPSRMACCA